VASLPAGPACLPQQLLQLTLQCRQHSTSQK
jgi:hypothetical protein